MWINGSLDVDAFRAALADVLSRHEVLRTVYEQDADGTLHPLIPTEEI